MFTIPFRLSRLKSKRKIAFPILAYSLLFLSSVVVESAWAQCMPSGTPLGSKCYCSIDHVEYSSASACLASAACAGTTSTCTSDSGTPPDPTPTEMKISLTVEGSGSGKVTTSEPELQCQTSDCQKNSDGTVACASNCSKTVEANSTVKLTAAPTVNDQSTSVFNGWTGDLDCTDGEVLMDNNHSCTADFTQLYKMTITINGPGKVTGSSNGTSDTGKPIDCGDGATHCTQTYYLNTRETLQATPTLSNAKFKDWSCFGTQNPISFQVMGDQTSLTCEANFTLHRSLQVILFDPIPDKIVGDPDFNVVVKADSGDPVIVTVDPASRGCSVIDQVVKIHGKGTCILVANQAGNNNYEPAPTVTQTFNIAEAVYELTKKDQAIYVEPVSTSLVVGHTVTLNAIGGDSGNFVAFTSKTPQMCTVSSHEIRFIAAGSCTLEADQAGNAEFNAAPTVTINLAVTTEMPTDTTTPTIPPTTAFIPKRACDVFEKHGVEIVNSVCNSGGAVFAKPLLVSAGSSTSDATICNKTENQGWLSNVTVTASGKIKGGVLSGFVKNQGIACDFNFRGGAFTGGNVCGRVQNTSPVGGCLSGIILLPGTQLTGGCLENATILPGATVAEVTFKGTIIALGSYQRVKMGSGVNIIKEISQIPVEFFQNFNTQALATLSECIQAQISTEQLAQIPPVSEESLTECRGNTFVPGKIEQVLSFETLSDGDVGDDDIVLQATASSNLPVKFLGQMGNDSCVVVENVVKILKPGACVVQAEQGGDDVFYYVSETQTFQVNPPKPCSVLKGDAFVDDACNGRGKTVAQTTQAFGKNSAISNMIIDHTVKNEGAFTNITLTKNGVIQGGQISGTVQNEGQLENVTVTEESQVSGGTVAGIIDNQGHLQNVQFAPATRVIGGSISGKLQGDATVPVLLDDIIVEEGSELDFVLLGPNAILAEGVKLGQEIYYCGDDAMMLNNNGIGKASNSTVRFCFNLPQKTPMASDKAMPLKVRFLPDLKLIQSTAIDFFIVSYTSGQYKARQGDTTQVAWDGKGDKLPIAVKVKKAEVSEVIELYPDVRQLPKDHLFYVGYKEPSYGYASSLYFDQWGISQGVTAPYIEQVKGWTNSQMAKLTNAQIMSLTPAQIATLSLGQINRLTTEHIGMLSDPQIQALTDEQIKTLSTAQLKALLPSQIAAFSVSQLRIILTGKTNLFGGSQEATSPFWPEQWMAFTKEQIQGLGADFIKALRPNNIALLGNHQIPWLNKEHLEALARDSEKISRLTKTHIVAFTKEQMVEMPISFIGQLNAEQIGNFTLAQFTLWDEFQVSAIQPSALAKLTAEHIRTLNKAKIRYLAEGQLRAFSVEQLKAFTDEQVLALRDLQVIEMGDSYVHFLTEKRISLLSKEQVTDIPKSYFPKMTVAQVQAFINNHGFSTLKREQVGAMTVEHIKSLTPKQIRGLVLDYGGPGINALTLEHIKAFSVEQVQALSTEQLADLTEEQVRVLNTDQLRVVVKNDEKGLPSWHVAILTDEQRMALLLADNVIKEYQQFRWQFLMPVESVELRYLKLLPIKILGMMRSRGEPLGRLTASQLAVMTSQQVDAIEPSVTQINMLSFAQITGLNKGWLSFMSSRDYPLLSVEKLSWATEESFRLLDVGKICHFTPEQVPVLKIWVFSDEQLKQFENGGTFGELCVPNQVSYLTVGQLAKLSSAQWNVFDFGWLTDAQRRAVIEQRDIVYAWPLNLFNRLTAKDFTYLDITKVPEETFKQLSDTHIKALTTPQIQALTDERIKFMSPKYFNMMSATQIQALTSQQVAQMNFTSVANTVIKSFTPTQVKALTTQQLSTFGQAQADALSEDHVAVLSIEQIQALYNASVLLKMPSAIAYAKKETETAKYIKQYFEHAEAVIEIKRKAREKYCNTHHEQTYQECMSGY